MSKAISDEMGAPIDWASEVQTSSGQAHLEDFILRLKEYEFGKQFNSNSNNYICYEPIGVCGLITPWNWPINQIALKVVPALATGLYNDFKTFRDCSIIRNDFCRYDS